MQPIHPPTPGETETFARALAQTLGRRARNADRRSERALLARCGKRRGLSPLAVVGAVRWKTAAEDSHPRVCGPGFALHMPLRWPPRQSDGARRRGLTSLERCRWRRIQIRAAAS
ncbi:hypothetical protein L1887_55044 [Cichorium endivia]|nr:hypothetical protein L1887_55044 [Cichorium endivia]